VNGNFVQQNIAANPTSAASCRSEWFAAFDRREREREMGDEKNRADGPRVQVVVQDKEIRGAVFQDGALHFGVGGINDSGAERLRLAL